MRNFSSAFVAYLYEFARPLARPAHGVPHTSETPFVFGTYADPFFAAKVGDGPDAAALSIPTLRAWASFAHSDVPGAEWAAATAQAPPIDVLGVTPGLHAVDTNLRVEELAALASG